MLKPVQHTPGTLPFSVCAAEEVLEHFPEQLIHAVDAPAIVFTLLDKCIIPHGLKKAVVNKGNPTEQNELLHAHMMLTCTKESMMVVCDILIGVEGNHWEKI